MASQKKKKKKHLFNTFSLEIFKLLYTDYKSTNQKV